MPVERKREFFFNVSLLCLFRSRNALAKSYVLEKKNLNLCVVCTPLSLNICPGLSTPGQVVLNVGMHAFWGTTNLRDPGSVVVLPFRREFDACHHFSPSGSEDIQVRPVLPLRLLEETKTVNDR